MRTLLEPGTRDESHQRLCQSAVDKQFLAIDVLGLRAGQENHRAGDVGWLADAVGLGASSFALAVLMLVGIAWLVVMIGETKEGLQGRRQGLLVRAGGSAPDR